MFSPKKILHPTDYSECSMLALQVASDLAKQYHSQLIVLHVVETLGPGNVTFGEVAHQLEPQGYIARLTADLHKLEPQISKEIETQYLVADGDPAATIERTAQQHGCDLIVMGRHGHRGFERLFLGSVAEHVVRRANRAVLTVKCPQAPAH